LLRAAHRLNHSARAELVKLAESWATISTNLRTHR
jgi:hypothetical protein